MNKKITPYQLVKKVALLSGYVKYYKNDILKHDRKDLYKYNGSFLYMIRECGSNLYKLDIKAYNFESENIEDIEKCMIASLNFCICYNTKFYFYDSKTKKLNEINKNDAYIIGANWIKKQIKEI